MRRLLLVPAFAVVPAVLSAQTPAELSAAAETITADAVAAHVRTIADDSTMGRDTPSPGLEKTARYVADQFKALGLKPGGGNGSWFQRYPIPPQLDFTKSRVVFTSGGKQLVAGFTGAARLADRTVPQREAAAAAVLVAGRQTAAGLTWQALRNKVIVYVPPVNADPAAEQKLLEQLRSASPGLVVVSALDSADFAARVQTALRQPDVQLGSHWSAHVRPGTVPGLTEMLAASGMDLARLRGDTTPVVRDLPSLQIGFEPQFSQGANDTATAPNVVAVLEGSDSLLRQEHILFVAHMDHTGIRHGQFDSIANGADDNASGVAGLIALAKAFSQSGVRPARSIVFLATSGGAKNFWGSREFVDQLDLSGSLGGLFGGIFQIVMGGGSGQNPAPVVQGGKGGQVIVSQSVVQFSFGNAGDQPSASPPATPTPATPPAATGDSGNGNGSAQPNPSAGSGKAAGNDAVIVLGGDPAGNAPGAGGGQPVVMSPAVPLSSGVILGGAGSDNIAGSNDIAVSHVVGVINLDMIGRHAGDSVVVDGINDLDLPTPLTWLTAAHPELKLTVVDGGTVANMASDHYPFVKGSVPSLYFHNGSHDQPTAESASAIDADLAARILRLAFYVGEDVANGKRPPQWNSEGRQHYLGILEQER